MAETRNVRAAPPWGCPQCGRQRFEYCEGEDDQWGVPEWGVPEMRCLSCNPLNLRRPRDRRLREFQVAKATWNNSDDWGDEE